MKKIEVDPNLFDNIIVNNIIKRSPFTYRRDKALIINIIQCLIYASIIKLKQKAF